MGDSESFSSLMDLVNSHLSKTSLNTSQSGDESSSVFPLASVRIQTGMSQTVYTPPNGIMSIPRLGGQNTEINGILAQQVTNMLIAKEKKRQEDEKTKKLDDEIKLLKQQKQTEDDYVIDLMSSIVVQDLEQMLSQPLPDTNKTSTCNSIESLLAEGKTHNHHDSVVGLEKPLDTLPLNRDMSYIMFNKVKKGRPSAFGKVISSRMHPVAAPYVKVEVKNTKVQRFNFSTQSPCDINLERRRHPPHDPYSHMNMVERFMAQTHNDLYNNI